MRAWLVMAVVASLLATPGCKGKKAKWASAPAGSLKAFGEPEQLGIGEDVYEAQTMDLDGKYLLYAIERDPKEGWGFGHGIQMYNYNTELKIKLPLGRIGRSTQFGFTYLDGKAWVAVIKTVDTNGDGDIDEQDANQLMIMAPDGLDEEPVSTAGDHAVGFWPDPRGEMVYFAVTDTWEGKKLKPEEEKALEGKVPTVQAFAWSFEEKATTEIGECLSFYGPSPDGLETACLIPDGVDEKAGTIAVKIVSTDGQQKKTVKLPTTADAQVAPLGEGKLVYTRAEASSTGKRRVLYVRGADGKDTQITNSSVDTTILKTLGDGGVLFSSRAHYSVNDGTAFRALSGDLGKVYDLLRVKGSQKLEIPLMSGGGKYLTYAVFPDMTYDANPRAKMMMATAAGKPESHAVADVVATTIAGLGDTIVEKLKKALGEGTPVVLDRVTVSVPMKRAVLPLKLGGEITDDALMEAVVALRDTVSPVLAEEGYDAVFPLEGLADAVGVMKWHEEFGRHLSYRVAYGHWVPVRSEYDLVADDLVFKKLPGCADPRLVQLHATGWITAVGNVAGKNLELLCRATPLDPNMKIREGQQSIPMVKPGDEAVAFDVIADKVDPRRSHRSEFDLLISADGKPVPYYDAAWAEATKAWIEILRGLPGEVLPTNELNVFAMGNETFEPLAKWFPSTVVRQEEHLDLHFFLDDAAPDEEDLEKWGPISEKLIAHIDPFLMEYDPDNVLKVRVSLYKGINLVTEVWHKTPEEAAQLGCENGEAQACLDLARIYQEQGKKMSAEMTFYEACDLGSEEACEIISGPATTDGDKEAKKEEPEEEPGKLEKKTALPPVPGAPVAEPPSLKKSEIQTAIKANVEKIKSCFAKDAVESANVSVKITIDGQGKVTDAKVKHSNVKPAVESCVLLQVKMVKFPATPDGEPFTFSYPFTYVK